MPKTCPVGLDTTVNGQGSSGGWLKSDFLAVAIARGKTVAPSVKLKSLKTILGFDPRSKCIRAPPGAVATANPLGFGRSRALSTPSQAGLAVLSPATEAALHSTDWSGEASPSFSTPGGVKVLDMDSAASGPSAASPLEMASPSEEEEGFWVNSPPKPVLRDSDGRKIRQPSQRRRPVVVDLPPTHLRAPATLPVSPVEGTEQGQPTQLRQSLAESKAAADAQAMAVASELYSPSPPVEIVVGTSPPPLGRNPADMMDEKNREQMAAFKAKREAKCAAIPTWPRNKAAEPTAPACVDVVELARIDQALISLRARLASNELSGGQFAAYVTMVKQGKAEPLPLPVRTVGPAMEATAPQRNLPCVLPTCDASTDSVNSCFIHGLDQRACSTAHLLEYRALLSAQKRATKQAPRSAEDTWTDMQAECSDGSPDENESDTDSEREVGIEVLGEDEMDPGVIRSQDKSLDSAEAAAFVDAAGSADAIAQAKANGMFALGKRKRGGTDFRAAPTETNVQDDSDSEGDGEPLA
jgi:hypothetical protein